MFYFKIFFAVFLSFVLVKSSYAQSESLNIEHLMESVAEIWIANTWPREQPTQASQSSGFFITDNLLVASYHDLAEGLAKGNPIGIRTSSTMGSEIIVMEDPNGIRPPSNMQSGFVLMSDPASDLVIIKTLKNLYQPVTLGQTTDIHKGDDILTIGSPQAEFGTVYEGILLSKIGSKSGSELLTITAPSRPGSSGSPVFSKDLGTVVGVVLGKASTDVDVLQIKEGTTQVIPVNKLRNLIERYRGVLKQATGGEIPRDLYSRALESKQSYDFYAEEIILCPY